MAAQSAEEGTSGDQPANKPVVIGEGGENGDIIAGKSLVFATLEVCLCVLVRHIPSLNPALPSTGFQNPHKHVRVSEETSQLLTSVLQVMGELPPLCSPQGMKTLFMFQKPVKCTSIPVSDINTVAPSFAIIMPS